jgi:hypothetical protein
MGKFSPFVNAWACLWTLFVSIIFILPTVRPVTALTMNYAIAFLALILLAALIWWYLGGRRYYTGPITEAIIVEEDVDVRDSSSQENEKNVTENIGKGN